MEKESGKLTNLEKDVLAEENMKLVHYAASRFKNYPVDHDELFSIALVGFTNALNKYDKGKDTKFSTYAMKCMTNEILHNLRAETKHIKNTILSGTVIHDNNSGNTLTIEDTVSSEMNDETSVEDRILLIEDQSLIASALETLEEREIEIISRRYGIGRNPETQNSIAESLNMSQANVSKIEQGILKKLYMRMRGKINLEESSYYRDFE